MQLCDTAGRECLEHVAVVSDFRSLTQVASTVRTTPAQGQSRRNLSEALRSDFFRLRDVEGARTKHESWSPFSSAKKILDSFSLRFFGVPQRERFVSGFRPRGKAGLKYMCMYNRNQFENLGIGIAAKM